MTNRRLPGVEFQHNDICTENHLVDLCRVALLATREFSVPDELHANNCKAKLSSSVQVEYT